MYDLPLPANFINNFGNFLPDERKRIRFCYLWALYFTATWDALLCKLTYFCHWAFNLFHSHVWFWYIHGHWFITSGFIAKHHNDQSPVGLLTELIEHCTDISEVMGSNPVRAWIYFRPYFHYSSSSVHYFEGRFYIHFLNPSSLVWFSYIHSHRALKFQAAGPLSTTTNPWLDMCLPILPHLVN